VDEVRADGIDLRIVAPEDARGAAVTACVVPDGIEAEALVRRVASAGWTLGDGYGPLRTATFRLGHMGEHSTGTLRPCLDAVRTALDDLMG
jgi:aspartate aminotransferase-like enzyme